MEVGIGIVVVVILLITLFSNRGTKKAGGARRRTSGRDSGDNHIPHMYYASEMNSQDWDEREQGSDEGREDYGGSADHGDYSDSGSDSGGDGGDSGGDGGE